MLYGKDICSDLEREGDHHDVGERSKAGPLFEWYPAEQDNNANEKSGPAK